MNENFSDELLSAYLDGELTAGEQAQVEEALARDPRIQQLLDELRGLQTTLQALPPYRLQANFAQRVLRQAEREMLAAPVPQQPAAAVNGAGESEPMLSPAQPARAGTNWHSSATSWRMRVLAVTALAASVMFMLLTPPRGAPTKTVALDSKPQSSVKALSRSESASAADQKEQPVDGLRTASDGLRTSSGGSRNLPENQTVDAARELKREMPVGGSTAPQKLAEKSVQDKPELMVEKAKQAHSSSVRDGGPAAAGLAKALGDDAAKDTGPDRSAVELQQAVQSYAKLFPWYFSRADVNVVCVDVQLAANGRSQLQQFFADRQIQLSDTANLYFVDGGEKLGAAMKPRAGDKPAKSKEQDAVPTERAADATAGANEFELVAVDLTPRQLHAMLADIEHRVSWKLLARRDLAETRANLANTVDALQLELRSRYAEANVTERFESRKDAVGQPTKQSLAEPSAAGAPGGNIAGGSVAGGSVAGGSAPASPPAPAPAALAPVAASPLSADAAKPLVRATGQPQQPATEPANAASASPAASKPTLLKGAAPAAGPAASFSLAPAAEGAVQSAAGAALSTNGTLGTQVGQNAFRLHVSAETIQSLWPEQIEGTHQMQLQAAEQSRTKADDTVRRGSAAGKVAGAKYADEALSAPAKRPDQPAGRPDGVAARKLTVLRDGQLADDRTGGTDRAKKVADPQPDKTGDVRLPAIKSPQANPEDAKAVARDRGGEKDAAAKPVEDKPAEDGPAPLSSATAEAPVRVLFVFRLQAEPKPSAAQEAPAK